MPRREKSDAALDKSAGYSSSVPATNMPMLPSLPTIPFPVFIKPEEFADVPALQGGDWEEAPSDMRPMAVFGKEDEGGSAAPCGIEGTFDGVRNLNVGGRNQTVYDVTMPDGQQVGIWGSSVLDQRMSKLNPDKNQKIVIVFVGETENAPKGNPAKIFRVWKFKAGAA